MYHASSISSKNIISNIIKSLQIWNISGQLVNILVGQFILSYKQYFFDQVVGEIRPELICGSGLWLFQRIPARGPEVRVAGLGCGLHRLRVQAERISFKTLARVMHSPSRIFKRNLRGK